MQKAFLVSPSRTTERWDEMSSERWRCSEECKIASGSWREKSKLVVVAEECKNSHVTTQRTISFAEEAEKKNKKTLLFFFVWFCLLFLILVRTRHTFCFCLF